MTARIGWRFGSLTRGVFLSNAQRGGGMLYCYAKLSDEEMEKVRAYEAETGKRALVLREVNVEADDLSSDELSRLRGLERELGYIAIVVK